MSFVYSAAADAFLINMAAEKKAQKEHEEAIASGEIVEDFETQNVYNADI